MVGGDAAVGVGALRQEHLEASELGGGGGEGGERGQVKRMVEGFPALLASRSSCKALERWSLSSTARVVCHGWTHVIGIEGKPQLPADLELRLRALLTGHLVRGI